MHNEHVTLPDIAPSKNIRESYAKLMNADLGLSSYVYPDFDVREETDSCIIISATS